jgi:putative transposase
MKLNLHRRTEKRAITLERSPFKSIFKLSHILTLDFMRDSLSDGRPFRTLNVFNEGNKEALK